MRIGIVPLLKGSVGGLYQYSVTMLRALDEWKRDGCEDGFVVFAFDTRHPIVVSLQGHGWAVKELPPPTWKRQVLRVVGRIAGEGPHREAWRWLQRRFQDNREQIESLPDPDVIQARPERSYWFHQGKVQLMLYPAPKATPSETGIPFVMAIHDLQHRLQPTFPEVSTNGEWEYREYVFRNAARYATLLLADSEVGKEDILNCYGAYGITPERVKVLPFLPACYLGEGVSQSERQRVRMTYHLPDNCLFYPAQFWPHKNHARIVQALGILKQEHHLRIPIVFCGSYSGEIREHTFREVILLAHQMGIEGQIHYLGYVPDEDMSALYADSVALVMPTFFGPTNIPVLEAWAFGCPVLTSDIRGIREQVGDAAVLVDPQSVEAIADGIHRLWTDDDLRRTLAERGQRRLASYTPDDYRQRLIEILEEAKARVRSEKPRDTA